MAELNIEISNQIGNQINELHTVRALIAGAQAIAQEDDAGGNIDRILESAKTQVLTVLNRLDESACELLIMKEPSTKLG